QLTEQQNSRHTYPFRTPSPPADLGWGWAAISSNFIRARFRVRHHCPPRRDLTPYRGTFLASVYHQPIAILLAGPEYATCSFVVCSVALRARCVAGVLINQNRLSGRLFSSRGRDSIID